MDSHAGSRSSSSQPVAAQSPADNPHTDRTAQYLLQYILSCRGIVHENALLLALVCLKKDGNSTQDTSHTAAHWQIGQWLHSLNQYIDQININLNPLNFKIIKINHFIDKTTINKHFNIQHSKYIQQTASHVNVMDLDFPQTNKFYIYVNLVSDSQTKLATSFNEREIEFIKWAIQQFIKQSQTIKDIETTQQSTCKQINTVVRKIDPSFSHWKQYTSFSVGSTKLLEYHSNKLSALEIELLLIRLCHLKWFARDSQGKFGMDLKCIVELNDYLLNEYTDAIKICQYCDNSIVIRGVKCAGAITTSNNTQSTFLPCDRIWHVDCFQHYIAHVSKECDKCNNSLISNSIYVI